MCLPSGREYPSHELSFSAILNSSCGVISAYGIASNPYVLPECVDHARPVVGIDHEELQTECSISLLPEVTRSITTCLYGEGGPPDKILIEWCVMND